MTRMHDSGVDEQVVVNELCGPRAVCEDAAYGSGDEIDEVGLVDAKPLVDGRLIAQVELFARSGERCDTVLT